MGAQKKRLTNLDCSNCRIWRFYASVHRLLPILLLVLAGSLSLCPCNADAGLMLSSPRPELTASTLQKLRRIENGRAIECKIAMDVKRGEVLRVAMSPSTGLKAADDEICGWVKRRWQFKPDVNGTFSLPIVLHPANAPITTPGGGQK
jgi:hypothetical protein